MVHLIAYDLVAPNDSAENYQRVINAIKSQFGTWAHLEHSVWLVETSLTASQVRDHVKGFVGAGDVVFVAQLNGNWASLNFSDRRNAWLKSRDFTTKG